MAAIEQLGPNVPATAGPLAATIGIPGRKYTLRVLNEEGYININTAEYPYDPDFAKDFTNKDTGGYYRKQRRDALSRDGKPSGCKTYRLAANEPYHIHPVLQRNQWRLASEKDWDLIVPSVELASRLLDDIRVLPFFAGLRTKITELKDLELQAAHPNKAFKKFDLDDERNIITCYEEMSQLRDRVKLTFRDADPNFWGRTERVGKTRNCLVSFHQLFLDILSGRRNAQEWSIPWYPGTDIGSAVLRTRFLLARVIVHEIAHAAWVSTPAAELSPEPYVRDHPVNELGFELENFLFSGTMFPLGETEALPAPYGFSTWRWPHIFASDPKQEQWVRGHPLDWGMKWQTEYPVHMYHIAGFFTKQFWDNVDRFGLQRLRAPRVKGVRRGIWLKKPDLGLSPKSTALAEEKAVRRGAPIEASIKADWDDVSDKEDRRKATDSFVVPGSFKAEVFRRALPYPEGDENEDEDMNVDGRGDWDGSGGGDVDEEMPDA